MKTIRCICVKRRSGFTAGPHTYIDTLRVQPDRICYEHKPVFYDEVPSARKWDYSTNSPEFGKLFLAAAEEAGRILTGPDPGFDRNAGDIRFTLVFSDRTRKTRSFFLSAIAFPGFFSVVRNMVPGCEDLAVLKEAMALSPTGSISGPET